MYRRRTGGRREYLGGRGKAARPERPLRVRADGGWANRRQAGACRCHPLQPAPFRKDAEVYRRTINEVQCRADAGLTRFQGPRE
jgi:hypothetical protein